MKEAEENEVLIRAITKWGYSGQIDMVVEECAELIQAINKVKRINPTFKHPTKDSSVKYARAYYNLCSEVADVKIMIRQLEMLLSKEAIELSKERKIERLKQRLDEAI